MVDIADIVTAAATVGATFIAIVAASDARRSSRTGRAETRHQGAVALASLLNEYGDSIRVWGDECIDWISQSHSLTFLDPSRMAPGEFFRMRYECLWRLSALIDRGRLFFPNDAPEAHGAHKPGAYRGFAPIVIDHLKAIRTLVEEIPTETRADLRSKDVSSKIVAYKRMFVTELQFAIDPREREARLRHPDIVMFTASPPSSARRPAQPRPRPEAPPA